MDKVRIHEAYQPLMTSKKRYFFLTGGRASLKSTSIHDFSSRLTYEEGHGILVTRYTMASAEKSIIPEFESVSKMNGSFQDFKKKGDKYTNIHTGSFILFSGIKTSSGDQTANLKSLAGITTWIIDEGEDFKDEGTFDDIDDSIRGNWNQNRVIWVQNPSTVEHFIYDRWIEGNSKYIHVEGHKVLISDHEDVEAIHTTYHIAESLGYLSQSFLNKVNKIKEKNPERYVHKYLGGWLKSAEGVVFPDWDVGEFNNELPFCYGMDFGFDDPDVMVKLAIDESSKIIYVHQELNKNGLGTDQLAEILIDIAGHNNLIIGDAAQKRLINDLYRKGLNIRRCKKGGGSVLRTINNVKGYKLMVTPSSIDVHKALNNYVWHDKRSGIPKNDYKHFPDAIGYAAIELMRL